MDLITEQNQYYAIHDMGNETYNAYIFGDIDDAYHYIEFCTWLRGLSNKAEARLFINCRGGYVSTTVSLLTAIGECQAHITTVAEGVVASAATLLFIAGNDYNIAPYTQFLFHPAQGGTYGKFADQRAGLDSSAAQVEGLYKTYYKGILTDEEIAQVIEHREFYLSSDEMAERLDAYAQNIADEMELALMEANEEAKEEDKQLSLDFTETD